MAYQWIKQENNPKIVVFYNGWGMDQSILSEMDHEDFDVLMVYQHHIAKPLPALTQYQECYLIAWSMGVWAVERQNHKITWERCIAINGTSSAVDDAFGIPQTIFKGTLENLSPQSLKKFQSRIYGGARAFTENLSRQSQRHFEDQHQELAWWHANSTRQEQHIAWDLAVIGTNDLIYNPKNQDAFWNTHTQRIAHLPVAHDPFVLLNSWTKITGLCQ